MCRHKNGNLITGKRGILRIWIEHFDEFLNEEGKKWMKTQMKMSI